MKQKILTTGILFLMINWTVMAQEEPMDKLSKMAGTWNCEETYHAGGWSETEVVSTSAKDIITYGINNQYITADYSSESAMGNYAAYAMIYYDAAKESYVLSFFDNFGNQQIQNGQWKDANTIVFKNRMTMNGAEGNFVRTYTFEGSDKQVLLVSFDANGKSQKLITIVKSKA